MTPNAITVQTTINAPISKVWAYWSEPEHVVQWAFASGDWEAPAAENDLRVGGQFKTTMAARDKSRSFDFEGTYTLIEEYHRIEYKMSDGREVQIKFEELSSSVVVTQTFDPEGENALDLQQKGWQAILDNFRKHVESN